MLNFVNPWYKLGRADANANRYPMYSVLIACERWEDARQYAAGWKAITRADLSQWRDRSAT
jgi:hypothetical protein